MKSTKQNQRAPIYWGLKYRHKNGFAFAGGCWIAPLIYANREEARKSAREFRENGLDVTPVRIAIDVKFWEVADGSRG